MPYQELKDLPAQVKNNLPQHAQEIYRAAFNSAWDEYNHDEERAHRVAWAAVENKYRKDASSGEWRAIDTKLAKLILSTARLRRSGFYGEQDEIVGSSRASDAGGIPARAAIGFGGVRCGPCVD